MHIENDDINKQKIVLQKSPKQAGRGGGAQNIPDRTVTFIFYAFPNKIITYQEKNLVFQKEIFPHVCILIGEVGKSYCLYAEIFLRINFILHYNFLIEKLSLPFLSL